MKCTYKILPEYSMILEKFEGAITIEDSISMTAKLLGDMHYNASYNLLIDLRDFTPLQKAQHHIQDIDVFFNFFNSNHSLPNASIVFIISEPIHAIISELFKEKVAESKMNVATFTTIPAALESLNALEFLEKISKELENI